MLGDTGGIGGLHSCWFAAMMKDENMNKINICSKLLALVGVITVLMGLHFMLIRPGFVFFPEDAKFTQTTAAEISPYLLDWIKMVFRSWGSFVFATGAYLIGISLTAFKRKEKWAWLTIAIASVVNFSVFFSVNVLLKGDFVPMIGFLLLSTVAALAVTYKDFFISARKRK